MQLCTTHKLEVIVGVSPDEPEDLTDLQKIVQPEQFIVRAAPVPGRNELCTCGSGRKYKKCCLRNPSSALDGS